MALAAVRGRQAETAALIDATHHGRLRLRGEGNGIAVARVGDRRAEQRCRQLRDGDDRSPARSRPPRGNALTDLGGGRARRGGRAQRESDVAAEALRRLAEITSASGTDWALGVEARSRALLSDGDTAERLYLESIDRLARTRIRADLARAPLAYGEWPRRQRRRVDARAQLRIAHEMLDGMGIHPFAQPARRELKATTETARKRTSPPRRAAHRTEALIARMARDSLSNPRSLPMFISARTVQYHLRKVFAKLGVESRTQLDRVLPD